MSCISHSRNLMDVKLILMLLGILMVVSQIQDRPSLLVTADVMAAERPRIKVG